jgi:putative transposase
VILDPDGKFDAEVLAFLTAAGLKAKRTSVRSPWQNGLAERWIESCRREILDHVIALNEQHLCRILREYVRYHHEDRLRDSLAKGAPNGRTVEQRPGGSAKIVSMA